MKKLLLSVIASAILFIGGYAQTNIANYTYTNTVGVFTPLTGATTFTNSWDDEVSGSIPLGGTFTFGSTSYTACFISANGFITFGGAPAGTNYTPLSTVGTTSAAISVFGRDGASSTAAGATPSISYMNIGGATGVFVVEYLDHATFGARATERLNSQIRLNLATGAISFVYGSWSAPGGANTALIGIRGATTTWSNNVNSLNTVNIPAGNTCDWSKAITSIANNSSMIFSTANTAIVPANGLTFTWMPPVNPSLAPVRQFGAVSGITGTSATITWTAPASATQYNVQYRQNTSCSWTNFAGNPVATNTAVLTGLTPATVYQVRVQSSDGTNNAIYSHIPNQAGTGGGYNTTAGTFSTATTCTVPTALNTSTVLASSANFTWTAGGTETAWDVYYGSSPLTPPTASTIPTSTTSTNSYSATGLSPETSYSVYVRANCGGGDLSVWTPVKAFATPCLPPNITGTTPNVRCGVGTTTLGATADPGAVLNWYNASTGGVPAGTGNIFTTPTLTTTTNFYVSAGNIATGSKSLGAGGTTGSLAAYDFANGTYGGMKTQYLYTAAELTAAGLTAGNINSLAFEFTTAGSVLNGFEVQMGTASFTTFPTPVNILGGLNLVYPAAAFTPVVGVNTINLTTPYNWDGTSNVIISISWSNNNTSNTASTIRYDATPNFASQSYRKDSETAINMAAFTGTLGSGTNTFDRTSSRPKITLSGNVICESARTAVTASVTLPDGVIASSSSSTLCVGGTNTATLTATQTGTTNAYSFTWDVSPVAGSGMPTPVSGSITSVSPTAPGTYVYTVTATDGVCTTLSSVAVTLNNVPAVMATATPSALCSGNPTTLFLGSAATVSPFVGNTSGTTINTTGTPYRTGTTVGNETRTQYLILGSELIAAGLGAGNLQSLSFIVSTAAPTGVMTNFSIGMAQTTATALTTTFLTPAFTNVYSVPSYTPINGTNTHAFSTPFNWDGVSNIVINVCGKLGTGGSGTSLVTSTTPGGIIATVANSTGTGCTDATGTTLTNQRPRFIITGNSLVNFSNISWTNGAVIGTTNPLTYTVTTSGTYSVNADANGCPVTATVDIISLPLPSAPVASNNTQCGVGVPTASVSGGTSYKWYATPTSSTVLQAGANSNYTSSISSTTTWYVSSYNGTCESPRVALTQSVTIPDAVTTSSSATDLCVGGANTITLTATNTGTTNTYSYTWNASPVSGSGMPTALTGSVVSVTPSIAGVYVYMVTAVDGSCTAVSSVTVNLNSLPSISAMATPTAICSGENVNLFAESINASAGTATVGAQTTTGTAGTPYRQGIGATSDLKVQYLYTKAELNAAGIFQGNITELRFNATTVGSGQIDNFVIKMGSTTTPSLATTYLASPSALVYGPYSYSVNIGQNVHTFDTPFYWDGVSNIIIEICHDAVNPSGTSSSVSMQTATNRTIYSGTTGACALTSGTSTTLRPVIGFGAQVGTNVTSAMNFVWNPGAINSNTAIVNPVNTGSVAATQVYTATVTNTVTGCVNSTTVGVLVNPLPSAPIAFDNIQCGIGVPTASVTGGPNFLWYASPTSTSVIQSGTSPNFTTSISSTTTWYVSSLSNTGCESSTRTALTQTVTPPPALTVSAPSAICAGSGIATFSITSTLSDYDSYIWSPIANLYTDAAATTPYTGTSASIVYIKSTNASINTVTVNASSLAGCANTAVGSITVNAGPISLTVAATPSVLCSGSTASLSVVSSPNSTLLMENFNGATNNWTTINNSTGGTPAVAAWLLQPDGYSASWGETLNSNDNSQFYLSNADILGSGSKTRTILRSPAINTTGLIDLNLNFYQYYNYYSGDSAVMVQVSTNGTSWTTLADYKTGATDIGTATSFSLTTFNLNSYINNPTLYIRFNYNSTWGFGWAIDNLSLTSTVPNGYSWTSSPAGFGSSVQNPTVSPSVNTTYSVTVTNTVTGCSMSGVTSISVNPTPTVNAVSSSTAICSGSSATLTASGATNYTWSPVGGTTATAIVTPTANSTYTVTGESLGCASTATVNLTVNTTPTVSASASSTVICSGGASTVTLTAVSTNSTYAWAPSGGTGSTEAVSPSANTIYTVTSDNAGCTATATVAIDVNPTPTVTAIASSTAFCSGNTATLTASGAANYTWSPSGDLTAISIVTPGSATVYTVTGESSGCSATATINLNVTQTPTVTASASPTAICLGNSAALTAVSSTPNYSWSPAGGTADIAIVSPSSNTTYTVTSTNGTCIGTATVDLAVISNPTITISPSNPIACSGSSITLTASGADTYTWSSGGGNGASAVFTQTAMTTYTVDGSNTCGNGSVTVTVGVDSPVTLSASTSATMICLGLQSATLSVTGTATSYTWSPGGQTTANVVVSPTVTTIYTVSTSNACGVVTSTVTQNVQDCTGIEELFAAGMNVYPNPATDVVNFSIPAHLVGQVKLEMYDALGKLVALEDLTKEVTSLKVTKFEAGVYMFKLISNNGDVKIGRLIKQ